MGMLLALGLMWVLTTLIHKNKESEVAERYTVATALQKVDSASILFFLGLLLAVAVLQSVGVLGELADFLNNKLKNDFLIGTAHQMISC